MDFFDTITVFLTSLNIIKIPIVIQSISVKCVNSLSKRLLIFNIQYRDNFIIAYCFCCCLYCITNMSFPPVTHFWSKFNANKNCQFSCWNWIFIEFYIPSIPFLYVNCYIWFCISKMTQTEQTVSWLIAVQMVMLYYKRVCAVMQNS